MSLWAADQFYKYIFKIDLWKSKLELELLTVS